MTKSLIKALAAQLLVLNLICACSGINFSEWRFPYMYPVQQGNYISATQLAQIKPGMTKEQVAFVVGNPVSQFMFNNNEWQYIFQQYKDDDLVNSYVININFNESNLVTRVESAGTVFVK